MFERIERVFGVSARKVMIGKVDWIPEDETKPREKRRADKVNEVLVASSGLLAWLDLEETKTMMDDQ